MHHRIGSNAVVMRRWLDLAHRELVRHSPVLDALNVFPVADSDTGTNLSATVRAAAEAAAVIETGDVGELLALAGQAAMEEARGNSGSLFSVFLTAVGKSLEGQTRLTAETVRLALHAGHVRAWSVLSDPVGGTLLSVLEAVAAVPVPAEVEAGSNQQLKDFLHAVDGAARAAVLATPEQLEVLRETGTVDAGALGMLIVFDTLARTVGGDDPEDAAALDRLLASAAAQTLRPLDAPHAVHGGVEVMCTVELSPLDAAELRHELSEVGTSVIMSAVTESGDAYRWRVHVHVERPEDALAVIGARGEPLNLSVTSLSEPSQPSGTSRADGRAG
ncbi:MULTISPECIES: DAK2 domain-containing protein [Kocuria]|uniref:DAK2 domain-containing protein n=1 Tax=Kocuria TaxID=57493 RepID=UPI0027E318C9|nr:MULTISPECIES: DAK2 domain-containing protein [Kocuria]HST72905.1 DAK2 domain-containing protein [Kocuria rosea]